LWAVSHGFGREDYTLSHAPAHTLQAARALKMNLPTPAEQFRYFHKQRKQMLDTIQQLVEIESPSDVKAAVDRLGTVLASRFGELGGRVQVHRAEQFGNHLEIRFGKKRFGDSKSILLIGHMDTVYPIGTIAKMPFRLAKGRVWGPGVLDMKAGIALILHVIETLFEWSRGRLPRAVTVFLASDEEVGSLSSRAITEKLARDSAAVLVLEPAHGQAVKTSRKGVGGYELRVKGKASHSGLDFEKGQSAVLELAHQILQIAKLTDLQRGITLNVGKVTGGTCVNVVPAEARASIDVRIARKKDAQEIERRLHALKPLNPNCEIQISGGMNRPPMERTAGVAALYRKATEIARELGWQLQEAGVGGGSDGNFTAALGVPTLDGLGAVGEGAHADHESILISELPRRAALLAGLIAVV
jgi:glutamate carboxypeptidase